MHFYRADNEHTHANSINVVNKITPEVDTAIREMHALNVRKPSTIIYNLIKKGLPPPSKSQLRMVLKKIGVENSVKKK